jgi:hypothetical protein
MTPPPPTSVEPSEPEEKRPLPAKFQSALYELVDAPLPSSPVSPPNAIGLLVEQLPTLASSKKEDAIPLIVATAAACGQERASVAINLLFNLRKKPQESERRAVIEGVRQLAFSTELLEMQVLPQAWELAGQKAAERRLLAAELCLALAPTIPSRLRQAMVLPMLQQLLLEAPEPLVREAAVKALAVVVAHTVHQDKYLQGEELCFMALEDQHDTVRQQAHKVNFSVLSIFFGQSLK